MGKLKNKSNKLVEVENLINKHLKKVKSFININSTEYQGDLLVFECYFDDREDINEKNILKLLKEKLKTKHVLFDRRDAYPDGTSYYEITVEF